MGEPPAAKLRVVLAVTHLENTGPRTWLILWKELRRGMDSSGQDPYRNGYSTLFKPGESKLQSADHKGRYQLEALGVGEG